MHIAILTFDGFNELDSLIALGILNRVRQPGWRVSLASPSETVTSMNGVRLLRQAALDEIESFDAVLVGSGIKTREIAEDASVMQILARLDAERQLIGAQCSGTLILAKLGLLNGVPGCTDLTTRPWVQEAGIEVLEQPFFARGNLATAGGCLDPCTPGGARCGSRGVALRRSRRGEGGLRRAGVEQHPALSALARTTCRVAFAAVARYGASRPRH